MGCIIKIEDTQGNQVFSFKYTNPERCTTLYHHLIEDAYFKANKMTIKLLSEDAEEINIHRFNG
jgi:hypothetical protein